MGCEYDHVYDEEGNEVKIPNQTTVQEKIILTGYVMLPCFKVELRNDEPYMVCNDRLAWIFKHIFARFWKGKVHITGMKKE